MTDSLATRAQRRRVWDHIAGAALKWWRPWTWKYAAKAWELSRMDDPPREWPLGMDPRDDPRWR